MRPNGNVQPKAEVISFPSSMSEDEEAQVAAFVRRVTMQLLPPTYLDLEYLRSGYLGIEGLLTISQRSFERLELLWAGLPPEKRRAMEDSLAPWYAEHKALMKRSKELADQLIAQRTAHQ